jgi:uroporphyrinogen decarboxylase
MEPKINDAGESIKIVAGRGPLAIGTHLMGLTEFLVGMKLDPDNMHKLLKLTTTLVKNWLEAQAVVLSEVEGILVLDDIVGFLSKDDYMEFAHPYLKEIFDAFPNTVKIYHNDTDGDAYYDSLEDLGVNIFNFTHLKTIAEVRSKVGDKVCLLGNIPPLEELVQGTPDSVKASTKKCLEDAGDRGIILSAGGGASPGTPKENIQAMLDALVDFQNPK